MLDQCFHLIQCMYDFRFHRLCFFQFIKQLIQFFSFPFREHRCHIADCTFFYFPVRICLHKCRNISGHCFSQIMEQAHPHHLVHITIREFFFYQPCKHAQTVGMFCYTFPSVLCRSGMAHITFQAFCHAHKI